MATNDLLPLSEIITPKPQKPNLVENVQEALRDPVRTLRDYLFTSGIRGYFERIFRDLKEGRGGGYWVQAEYGGGKTHFLSTLLCLLGESSDADEAAIWAEVSDNALRSDWEQVIRPRRLLGAHMSLMGTAAALGDQQPRLVDLIDRAVVAALKRHGCEDPGIGAGDEIIRWYRELDAGIRASIESAFKDSTGLSVESHLNEYDSAHRTAEQLLAAATSLGLAPSINVEIQDHFLRILDQLKPLSFDGLVIVIDEYYSRQGVLSETQAIEDGSVLETLGYKLGRQSSLPIYLVVASQSEIPAKLVERMDPFVLLRDEDNEYRQIVCRRIMDYRDAISEQAILYHNYYKAHFQFLRRSAAEETREIFPFQSAVFRFLRSLVGSSRISLPSTRFAIGVAYDAISDPPARAARRLLTRSDLLVGDLERGVLSAADMKDAAAALRQARDYIDNIEWTVTAFEDLAQRLLNYLFLESVISDQGATIEQIVEGTVIQDPTGLVQPKQIVQTILQQLKGCPQIELKGDNWRFTWRVTEGEQFESIFQRVRRDVSKSDPRVSDKWTQLLTANIGDTQGVPAFLAAVVSNMSIAVDHCGVQYAAKAVYSQSNLVSKLQPLERITHGERARVVVVPKALPDAPVITDAGIAVVAPGDLPESVVNDIRGIIACEEIIGDFRIRSELGSDRIVSAAEQKSRELTRAVVGRQKEVYREGEIYTKDSIPLNEKQLFRESLTTGVTGIASQVVRSAYPSATKLLNASRARRGPMATADSGKLFDAVFGGVTEARTRGAAESYGPVLGLSTPQEPLKLMPNAGPGPDAIAEFISTKPDCDLADLYDRFCSEPYGLPAEVVDLLVLACVALSKPYPLELRPPVGVASQTRDRRMFTGAIRAGQLRILVWPRSLKGYTLVRSHEATWNDFVSIAQAIDPERFSMATDQHEIELQEAALRDRLEGIATQIAGVENAAEQLSNASGEPPAAEVEKSLQRLAGLAEMRKELSREAAMKYAEETWQGGAADGIRADMKKLTFLASLVAEAPKLTGRVSWFRALCAAAPQDMETEIALTKPLVTMEQITAGPGQLATASQQLDETWAKFMARFREQHDEHISWVDKQRQALSRGEGRMLTLKRLNRLVELGPPDLPDAEESLQKGFASLVVCGRRDELDVGTGISCLSCRFTLGQRDDQPLGELEEEAISQAIDRRARSLTQGLIGEAIRAAGDSSLMAILAAAQAGEFRKIVDDDLLSDELIKRLKEVLTKAKQQTVASETIFEFIATHPHITHDDLDEWLGDLRKLIEATFDVARKKHPGKQVTLLLRSGDDQRNS